jgi:O-acetyl-ADP-ribose deacetylase (regulator of RNase III)
VKATQRPAVQRPAVSAGIYGWPADDAAGTAVTTVHDSEAGP